MLFVYFQLHVFRLLLSPHFLCITHSATHFLHQSATYFGAHKQPVLQRASSLNNIMVQKIEDFLKEYLQCLQGMSILPKPSYGHRMLWEDGGSNTTFLYYLPFLYVSVHQCCLLLPHFRYITLPLAGNTEISLSLMTLAPVAILCLLFSSPSSQNVM